MKVSYDKEVDAFSQLSDNKPEGAIEVEGGINIDVSESGQVIGIELLDASKKVSLDTLLTYEIAAEGIGEWIQAKGQSPAR